jgi:hypothetical protein
MEGIKDIAEYRVARGEGVSEDYMIKGDKNSRWFKLFIFFLSYRGLQHSETEVWKWFILDSRTIPLHHEGNISRHRSVSSIFTSPIYNRGSGPYGHVGEDLKKSPVLSIQLYEFLNIGQISFFFHSSDD